MRDRTEFDVETSRLRLRWFRLSDDSFIRELVNEPAWLEHIGDKGVDSCESAQTYLREGPLAMYERYGFGLNLVETKEGGVPIGMCGLLKREQFDDVDLGFAFFQRYWGQGYARESVEAVLHYGQTQLDLKRLVAITSPENHRSERLLERVGFRYDRDVRLVPEAALLHLWRRDLVS